MSNKPYEGQMDFLGLLNEYTDSQGAKVRVREPGKTPVKPRVKEPEPEQLKIEFIDLDEEFEKEMEALKKTEPKVEKKAEPKPEPKPETKPEPKAEPKPEPKPKAKSKPAAKPAPEPEKEPEIKPEKEPEKKSGEILFKQCKKCWCFDCKHNSRNEGVPREMCGATIPCPACDGCVQEDQATICEIGNAKEGCRFRAMEEGILVTEEM